MHEMTVVLRVVKAIDSYAEENKVEQVKGALLQIGGLTGIIPSYVTSCWKAATDMSQHAKGAEVRLVEVPGVGVCQQCRRRFFAHQKSDECPNCGSIEWKPVMGQDVLIKEIYV